jgi:hypothetical protein
MRIINSYCLVVFKKLRCPSLVFIDWSLSTVACGGVKVMGVGEDAAFIDRHD